MNAAMLKKLGNKVDFSGIYYCTHLKETDCGCRKPKTGMIDKAFNKLKKEGLSASLKKTYFIGDSVVDVQTGKNAKIKTILVFSGREKPGNQKDWQVYPDFTAKNLSEAADIVLNTDKK
jgi:HAD superfamily hydrolase (TIGR01662 family)